MLFAIKSSVDDSVFNIDRTNYRNIMDTPVVVFELVYLRKYPLSIRSSRSLASSLVHSSSLALKNRYFKNTGHDWKDGVFVSERK
jgi:hypothetical protein